MRLRFMRRVSDHIDANEAPIIKQDPDATGRWIERIRAASP